MDLQVPQDEEFQRREWRWERAGWAAMAALLVAGLAGLLGSGPASWARAEGSAGLVEVEYQRVTHHEADDSLTLTLAPRAAQTGTVTVEFTGSWVAGVDVQGITPQPSEQLAVPGGVALRCPSASRARPRSSCRTGPRRTAP